MPTPAFLEAAKSASRRPRILLTVESHDAIIQSYGSSTAFLGSAVKTNVDLDTELGWALAQVNFTGSWESPDDGGPHRRFLGAFSISGYARETVASFRTYGTGNYRVQARIVELTAAGAWTGTVVATSSTTYDIEGSFYKVFEGYHFAFPSNARLASGKSYGVVIHTSLAGGSPTDASTEYVITQIFPYLPVDSPLRVSPETAQLKTSVIDMGAAPSVAARFEVAQTVPYGTTVQHTVYAGNTSPPSTNLGVKVSGDTLGGVGYRYYQIVSDFTASAAVVAKIDEYKIVGGDSQFDYYGTHEEPTADVQALLPENPIGSLASKIDLRKMATVGEIKVRQFWVAATGDKLKNGYLKNMAAGVSLGFEGLGTGDYEPIFTGVWHDYDANAKSGLLTISLRDVLKKFEKVKIPVETFGGDGAKTTSAISWAQVNIVQAMLDVLTYAGIPSRFVDEPSFTSLRDGYFSGSAWRVTRTVTKPVAAWTLLSELCSLAGVFLVPQADGRLTAVRYDASAAASAVIDAKVCEVGQIDGNFSDLFSRQYVYYGPFDAEPSESADKYQFGYVSIDGAAETAWGETSEQNFYDKWRLGWDGTGWNGSVYTTPSAFNTTGVVALAARWKAWFANPRMKLSLAMVPLQHIAVRPGQIVEVDNLQIPCNAASWPGLTLGKRFLLLGRTVDLRSCTLRWDLMEI